MKLVNEMLDKLPIEVWTNEKLKWFDPASGMGNFPIAIYLRLMEGLKNKIKKEEERKRHILNNMLYISELNIKNVWIYKQIFDINNEYKLNINIGDTLKLNIKDKFKIDKFDIIIGNPPYQDDSGNKGKGHTLWTRFVEISLNNLLNENGYLVFIHPSLWRQINHDMLKLLKQKQIIYLEIHNSNDGIKMFQCATRYDWYVLCNKPITDITIIKDEDGIINNINLIEWSFIPNMMFDEIKNILTTHNYINILSSRSAYGHDKKWMKSIQDETYKYKCIYSINKNNELNCRYSSINTNGHFGVTKFIFSNGAGFIQDKNGEYGLTQWASAIIDTIENLELIEQAFRSEKFNKIKNAIQIDSSTYNIKVMKLFRKDFYTDFINK